MVNQRPFYEHRSVLHMFTCRPAPFLVIRRGQPKAQPSFLDLKGQPALFIIVGLAAALRVLCRKCRQQLFEIGIVYLGTVKYYAQIHLQVWQNSVCTGQGNLPLIT